MALTNCKECGRKVSTRARNCPGCGAPIKRKSSILAVGCLAMMGVFSIIFCAGIIGSGIPSPPKSPNKTSTSITINEVNPTKPNPRILEGVDYTIIKDETFLDYKRSIDVRLSKKITEEQLKALGQKLKSEDPKQYERTFVCYYLPEMIVDSGAWATSHFNPDLKVEILDYNAPSE